MQRHAAKARVAYKDFLTLWQDADPDIPVLIAAKSEYSKLAITRRSKGATTSVPN